MKFFFLFLFLICFSQFAWAGNPCSPWIKKDSITAQKCQQHKEELEKKERKASQERREKRREERREERRERERQVREARESCFAAFGQAAADIYSTVNTLSETGSFKVDSEGLYVDSYVWEFLSLKDKEGFARVFAIYRTCHILKIKDSGGYFFIDILDNRSGKKLGELSARGRYRAE